MESSYADNVYLFYGNPEPRSVNSSSIKHRTQHEFQLVDQVKTAWKPTPFRLDPVLGILALLIAFASAAGCIAVLKASDGERINTGPWNTASPSVCLAILVAIGNGAIAFSLSQSATLSWWQKALKGASVRNLHEQWAFGTSIWASTTAGRSTNLLSLSKIIATLVFINGPLLQRSSSVRSQSVDSVVSIRTALAPEVPAGYTAYITGRTNEASLITKEFQDVVQDYTNRVPITSGFAGCEDGFMCSVSVLAAALDRYNCTTTMEPLEYTMTAGELPAFASTLSWTSDPLFRSGDRSSTADYETITLTASYFNASGPNSCSGEYVTQTCVLRPVIAEYHLRIQNSTATFADSLSALKTVAYANNTGGPEVDGGGQESGSALGGLYLAGKDLFTSNVTVYFSGAIGMYQLMQINTFATQYLSTIDPTGGCARHWQDPTDDILAALNNMMFRTSLRAANVNQTLHTMDSTFPVNQTFIGTQRGTENVYSSHYRFLYGAVAIMLLAMLLIVPNYWGWWKLGRCVSLSPIEIAKAFDASSLADCGSDMDTDAVLAAVGDRRVKYGFIRDVRGIQVLKMHENDVGHATKPGVGNTFGFVKLPPLSPGPPPL